MANDEEEAMRTVERLLRVTNDHDIEGIVACFAEDYALESPIHPSRSFRGREQVRRNWTQIFGAVPDIATRIVASACNDSVVWTEWEMSGTRRDGARQLMRGVFVFGVSDGAIRSGRMFLEPVDEATDTMDAALREQLANRGKGAS